MLPQGRVVLLDDDNELLHRRESCCYTWRDSPLVLASSAAQRPQIEGLTWTS